MTTFPLLIFFRDFDLYNEWLVRSFYYSGFHFHKDLTSKQVRMTLMLHAQVGDVMVKDNCSNKDSITFFENQILSNLSFSQI